jgi:hypothetical protein
MHICTSLQQLLHHRDAAIIMMGCKVQWCQTVSCPGVYVCTSLQ